MYKVRHVIEQDDQKFSRIVCGDVSHNVGSSTEACGSVFVALNTLPDEGNLGSHVPANGSANIRMCSKCLKLKCKSNTSAKRETLAK